MQQYALTYDIIHWHWARGKRDTYANSVIGKVDIQHMETNGQVTCNISQETLIGGVNNFVKAQIICNTDELNSLRRWNFHSYEVGPKGKIDSPSKLTEKGSCRGGCIRIDSSNSHYAFYPKMQVLTQWTILDVLIRKANPYLSIKFDLLQDLSLFKPNQSLVYDGKTLVKCKDGHSVTLQTYAQVGEGILPIHYLLGARGHPQLVTSSMISWALSKQSAIT
jgi:hypothetical protein